MSKPPLTLFKGTLDLLILKTVSLRALHGYEIAKWVQRRTADELQIEYGALYQALIRLEAKGLLEAEWRASDTGREVRFYSLTGEGRRQLQSQSATWDRYVRAMAVILGAERA